MHSIANLRCRYSEARSVKWFICCLCGACALKAHCTSGAFRFLAIHMDEPARQRARELANTEEFAKAQRQRKKVEALFAELKNQIGLRRLRLRRLKFVREQFFLGCRETASSLACA